ncbi:hypothetical protein BS50DRAFT_248308 [Corynespora cassiicola Philippines]|uniref:Uncharacterized protein n=1 Tax=Corynespora cassiicola Philippines TaxID=1448308 RepID=A0A2T2P3P8_CORCC|nr:hypothetical protein BS50DRAFT_248308 [Corynespora cassiicola Philippines]
MLALGAFGHSPLRRLFLSAAGPRAPQPAWGCSVQASIALLFGAARRRAQTPGQSLGLWRLVGTAHSPPILEAGTTDGRLASVLYCRYTSPSCGVRSTSGAKPQVISSKPSCFKML